MAAQIPATHADLLQREKKAFANLAMVTSKGEPHVTPMWFDFDGTNFIFNTARGRVKDRIMHKHPVVAFAITDPNNSYRYIEVRGPIISESEEGAWDQICNLNLKYHGHPNYPKGAGEVRVTYRVRPEHVSTMG